MQVKRALETHAPGLSVVGSNYPPSPPKALLAKGVGVAQFLVIGATLGGQHLYPAGTEPAWLKSLQESKLQACMAAWFMGNVASQNLISTGAFEVYHDGAVIFSKLETGKAPDLNAIVEAVLNARRAALAVGRGAQ